MQIRLARHVSRCLLRARSYSGLLGLRLSPNVKRPFVSDEAVFLEAVVGQLDWAAVQFKLAPTYTLYMACRYRASTHFRPEISPAERAQRLTALANRVGTLVRATVEHQCGDPGPLAFWLANASELLHFLRQDRHLSAYTLDAQDLLTEGVQLAFRHLVAAQRRELAQALPRAFLAHEGSDSAIGSSNAVNTAFVLIISLFETVAPGNVNVPMPSVLFRFFCNRALESLKMLMSSAVWFSFSQM